MLHSTFRLSFNFLRSQNIFPRKVTAYTTYFRPCMPSIFRVRIGQYQCISRKAYRTHPNEDATDLLVGACALLISSAVYGAFLLRPEFFGQRKADFVPQYKDYQKIYDTIAERLYENFLYDDGSYGPFLIRLAYHASGITSVPFAYEELHEVNASLQAARKFLEPIKKSYPWITYSDLWVLGGVCAIQEMRGPKIPYRAGRSDRILSLQIPDSRRLDNLGCDTHPRALFGPLGLDDRAIVALSCVYALGSYHHDKSNPLGQRTSKTLIFTNDYFKLLLRKDRQDKERNGHTELEHAETKTLKMSFLEMELLSDISLRHIVDLYAKDTETFFRDFRNSTINLFELGLITEQLEAKHYVFETCIS